MLNISMPACLGRWHRHVEIPRAPPRVLTPCVRPTIANWSSSVAYWALDPYMSPPLRSKFTWRQLSTTHFIARNKFVTLNWTWKCSICRHKFILIKILIKNYNFNARLPEKPRALFNGNSHMSSVSQRIRATTNKRLYFNYLQIFVYKFYS